MDGDLTIENEPGEVVRGALIMGLLGLRRIDLGQPDPLAATLGFHHDRIPVYHPPHHPGDLLPPAISADD